MPDTPYLRAYYGHPVLPAGYNADSNNDDEVDGAGTNWPIWPMLTDCFEALEFLILTPEMLEIFESGCPDWAAAYQPAAVTFAAEPWQVVLTANWPGHLVDNPSNVLAFPREAWQQTISSDWGDVVFVRETG